MKILEYMWYYIRITLVLLFILFEDLAWNKLGKPVYEYIKSFEFMDRFKSYIVNIEHKYLLVSIFITPFLTMELFSFLAADALSAGFILTAILLYIVKLILTVPVVIIFNSGKSILVTCWIIRYPFGMILKFKRSKIFRVTKLLIISIKNDLNFIKTDKSILDGFRKIYKRIKRGTS